MNKNNQKEKNKDINIKTIWNLLRSEKFKKYSFIIFYFFFFIFLFIFINTNNNTTNNNSNTKIEDNSLPFITKNLENNNYQFKYIINSNLNELDYKGEKINNIIYINDDVGIHEFNYQNGNLISIEDYNILHKELFDIFTIKRIIKSSKLISETKLTEENKYIYSYTITNKDLSFITLNNINNINNLNEIIVKTKENKEIESIKFNLLNYEKELNSDLEVFNILLEIGENNG